MPKSFVRKIYLFIIWLISNLLKILFVKPLINFRPSLAKYVERIYMLIWGVMTLQIHIIILYYNNFFI